jgi:hypothetical protein
MANPLLNDWDRLLFIISHFQRIFIFIPQAVLIDKNFISAKTEIQGNNGFLLPPSPSSLPAWGVKLFTGIF